MWPVFINSILLWYKQRMIFLPFSVLPWYKLSSELSVEYQVTNPLNVFVSQLSIRCLWFLMFLDFVFFSFFVRQGGGVPNNRRYKPRVRWVLTYIFYGVCKHFQELAFTKDWLEKKHLWPYETTLHTLTWLSYAKTNNNKILQSLHLYLVMSVTRERFNVMHSAMIFVYDKCFGVSQLCLMILFCIK